MSLNSWWQERFDGEDFPWIGAIWTVAMVIMFFLVVVVSISESNRPYVDPLEDTYVEKCIDGVVYIRPHWSDSFTVKMDKDSTVATCDGTHKTRRLRQ